MRLTFAIRNRSVVTLVLGRKDQDLKRGLRIIIRDRAREAHAIAYLLCPVDTGRMQRLLTLAFTPAGFGFDLGWQAIEFRREGVAFYPPWVVLGTSRQAPQDPLTPAYAHVRPGLERDVVRFARRWAKAA